MKQHARIFLAYNRFGGSEYTDETLFLFLQHTNATGLELPGGRLEDNETPEDAVLREIPEELDIALDGARLTKLLAADMHFGHSGIISMGHYFIAKVNPTNMKIKEPEKITAAGFTDCYGLVLKIAQIIGHSPKIHYKNHNELNKIPGMDSLPMLLSDARLIPAQQWTGSIR